MSFDRLRIEVDDDVARFDDGMSVALRAADDRVDPRDQFVLVEGLGHVIVGAVAEAADLRVDVGGAREDQDGGVHPRHPELLQHVVAVHVGQRQVEYDDVVIVELTEIDAFLAQVGRVDIEALGLQHQLDTLRCGAIVFDQQDSHVLLPAGARSRQR